MKTAVGYQSRDYASSFGDNRILTLPNAGSHFLSRPLLDGDFDLAGIYPYCVVDDWFLLASSREQLRESGAASVVLVTSPFADKVASESFRTWDFCRPFKRHQVVDLGQHWQRQVSKKVRYDIRRAYKSQTVDVLPASPEMVTSFWSDYQNLIDRHGITGFHQFSKETLRRQLAVPGGMMAIARDFDDVPLGQILLYGDGRVAHAHLWAVTNRGYELATAYALFDGIITTLQKAGYRYLNLGGAAGQTDRDDGLLAFKRRWASEERMTYLCGAVLDRERYNHLVKLRDIATQDSSYFPAYRRPDA